MPLAHSAAFVQAMPLLVQPVWSGLHVSGWAPLQRSCPGVHVAVVQVPLAALQSAAVAQAEPWLVQPVWPELHVCGCAWLQRVSPGMQVGGVQVPPLQRAAVAHAVPLFW